LGRPPSFESFVDWTESVAREKLAPERQDA